MNRQQQNNPPSSLLSPKAQETSIPVMILNWNGWQDTERCLRQIANTEPSLMVWVVDNGSSEDRSNECLKINPQVRILKLEENLGWSGGYNVALRVAGEEGFSYAYLLNNDTVPEPGFIRNALAAIDQDPSIAAVGSTILYEGGQGVKFDGEYYGPNAKPFVPRSAPENSEAAKLNGAGMLIRMKAFNECGPFDERFFCYNEETEWCVRARKLGWRLVLATSSVIYHACEGSNTNGNALYYRTRNTFLMASLHDQKFGLRRKLGMARKISGEAWRRLQKRDEAGHEVLVDALIDGWSARFGKRKSRAGYRSLRAAIGWYTSLRARLGRKPSA